MSKELKFEFNDYIIAIDEPYENDCGYVAIGKKQSNGISIVFKSPNEKTVNWFIELQKHITNLQSQLDQANERLKDVIVPKFKIGQEIYSVGYLDIQSWVVDRIELGIINGELCEIYRLGHIGTDDYNCCILPQDNEKFFATLEEAEKKLQELRGGE